MISRLGCTAARKLDGKLSAMFSLFRRPSGLHIRPNSSQINAATRRDEGRSADEVCSIRVRAGPLTAEEADFVSSELLCLGATSASVEEYRPDGIEREKIFGTGKRKLWSTCELVLTFPLDADIPGALSGASMMVGREIMYVQQQVLAGEWMDAIKQEYKPMQMGPNLWICPAGTESTHQAKPGEVRIILEPGLAFGTGEHPTTRLCLRHLGEITKAGDTIMDYGAGSGVLAIGGLLFGATEAVGTDVDAFACRAAAMNAALNGVEDKFTCYQCGPSTDDPEPLEQHGWPRDKQKFSIVVANILMGPLTELRSRLTRYAAPGAELVLSGVLEEQAKEIMELYSADFENMAIQTEDGWACLTGRRKM